jgi:hypothetical protein
MACWLVATCEYYNVFVTYRPREIRIDLTLLLSFFFLKKKKLELLMLEAKYILKYFVKILFIE